jgi:hypothetical protein
MVPVYRPPDASSICIYLLFSFVIALGLGFANGGSRKRFASDRTCR